MLGKSQTYFENSFHAAYHPHDFCIFFCWRLLLQTQLRLNRSVLRSPRSRTKQTIHPLSIGGSQALESPAAFVSPSEANKVPLGFLEGISDFVALKSTKTAQEVLCLSIHFYPLTLSEIRLYSKVIMRMASGFDRMRGRREVEGEGLHFSAPNVRNQKNL